MIKVRECFMLGLIDAKHILIHLSHEDDYICLFVKPSWYFDGGPMLVIKLTPGFSPEHETPIVLVNSLSFIANTFSCQDPFICVTYGIGIPLATLVLW